MKKFLLIIMIIPFFLLGCGEEKSSVFETLYNEEKIEFPFKKIDNGKFININRNLSTNPIPISMVMISQNNIDPSSQSLDYCEGVQAIRTGKIVNEWTIINHNYSLVPESNVINQNDHPNFISYSLPKGTYMIMMMDSIECNRENYVIFDVMTNDGFIVNK